MKSNTDNIFKMFSCWLSWLTAIFIVLSAGWSECLQYQQTLNAQAARPAANQRGSKSTSNGGETKCQAERRSGLGFHGVGQFIPQCDVFGNYVPLQYWGSTGYSFCVDRYGNKLEKTMSGPGVPDPYCAPLAPTRCQVDSYMLRVNNISEAVFPDCNNTDGEFEPLQVDKQKGCKWCVDRDGTELEGTRVGPGKPDPRCLPIHPKMECIKMAEAARLLEQYHIDSIFAASCDAGGWYQPLQVDSWKPAVRWCVDKNGVEIPGTRVDYDFLPNPECPVRVLFEQLVE